MLLLIPQLFLRLHASLAVRTHSRSYAKPASHQFTSLSANWSLTAFDVMWNGLKVRDRFCGIFEDRPEKMLVDQSRAPKPQIRIAVKDIGQKGRIALPRKQLASFQ